jgi:hypothetical protein
MRGSTLFVITLLTSLIAEADSMNARIEASAQGYQGNLAVNQAGGIVQQQVNARALSVGGFGRSTIEVRQELENLPLPSTPVDTRASIAGNSFSNGRGVLGVNQSAGIGNQQINAMSVTLMAVPQSLDDSTLAQSVTRSTDSVSTVPPASGERRVDMSNEAFAGSRGVVQLNQSAGIGNRTANHLSIRVVD